VLISDENKRIRLVSKLFFEKERSMWKNEGNYRGDCLVLNGNKGEIYVGDFGNIIFDGIRRQNELDIWGTVVRVDNAPFGSMECFAGDKIHISPCGADKSYVVEIHRRLTLERIALSD
jgi:hypothetical protein